MPAKQQEEDSMLSTLIEVGIALTAENNHDRLLERVVTEARTITRADGGSLYLCEGDLLKFVVSQNETLATRLGSSSQKGLFKPFTIPISTKSIAGFVAKTGQIVNIEDVYEIPADRQYSFMREFDERNDYRTKSMLTVPLMDPGGHVIGVLGLINKIEPRGKITVFTPQDERVVMALASQAAVAMMNAKLSLSLKDAHLDTILRLSVAAEYRDLDTAGHIRRISDYCAFLGGRMRMEPEQLDLLKYSSPMHDVGKIGVPDAILLKPGKLTPDERRIMETHAAIGAKILAGSDSDILRASETVARSHHEKWNGSGYPMGLSGKDIPLFGRIVAIADVFDALISRRCYKPAMPHDKVKAILVSERAAHFDPELLDLFMANWDEMVAMSGRYRADEEDEEPR